MHPLKFVFSISPQTDSTKNQTCDAHYAVLLCWKPHYICPTTFLHNNIHKKDVVYSCLHGKNNIAYSRSSFFFPKCPLLGPPLFLHIPHNFFLIFSGILSFQIKVFLITDPLFIKARYIECTRNLSCWCKFQMNTSLLLFKRTCMILWTKLYQRIRLFPVNCLWKETCNGSPLRTFSTVSLFLLAMLYKDGYWSLKMWFPIHLSSQNLIWALLFNWNLLLTFIKLD
jgi:hypothetical protein